MGLGLTLSAIVAYVFGTDMAYMRSLVSETGMTGLGYVVMFAPIAFVFAMSLGFQRFSSTVMLLLFLVYSIVMGMSLSFIFMIYTHGSIFQTFGIAALTFGVMAVMGYTTKTDLTKFGSILLMALVGIIIASLVNMFLKSSGMEYIISFIGVLIFTGLTAYDVQKLKRIGSGVEMGTENTTKLAIFGALTLYLDFINLFLFLLRFFGNRRN
jgi:FtsH-binding integral membrane protein